MQIIYPKRTGTTHFFDIPTSEILPFVNWTFFFSTWDVSGKYDDIRRVYKSDTDKVQWLKKFMEPEHRKAEEALKLYGDAHELLNSIGKDKTLRINAVIGIYPAHADSNDNITIDFKSRQIIIPTLRQQKPSADGFCYALADFLSTETDFIGLFANTVTGIDKLAQHPDYAGNIYHNILLQTLADRLAEATAEWLHYKVRTEIWAYSPDEKMNVPEMFKTHYQGIRPAVGYPSLPDQSIIFELDKILKLNDLGISLTENGAMLPASSICGLMFAHPSARYFITGKIDAEQLADYARRRGQTPENMRKWLAGNL